MQRNVILCAHCGGDSMEYYNRSVREAAVLSRGTRAQAHLLREYFFLYRGCCFG